MQTPKIRYREVSETSPEAEDQSLVLRGELISDVVVWRTDLPSNVVILEATEKKCFFWGVVLRSTMGDNSFDPRPC